MSPQSISSSRLSSVGVNCLYTDSTLLTKIYRSALLLVIVCSPTGTPAILALVPMIIDLTNGSDPESDLVVRRTGAVTL